MEPETLSAPPVVAVVVVHEPGDWFEETVEACAEQDYPNLRFLFLVTEPGERPGAESSAALADIESVVTERLPEAFVRSLGSNPGFAAAANEVSRLVEGESGFFLFCHDDIAPEHDAVRLLVEELYRSNAGAVGPKLVDWDDPGILKSVGLGLDRFGEIDQPVELGEVDQEQHDGVRDVFVLPSACVLVRADLFRELSGFDDALTLYGEDVEFCWRVHLSGARVVVAPSARVRHRGALVERRPHLHHSRLAARHRLRSVATLTGAARLPGRILELVLLTLAELVVGTFTGRFRQGLSSVGALVGLVPRIPAIIARRREIADLRRVPEREVLGLQQRGSARLHSWLRTRDTATFVSTEANVRRWRESSTAPVIAWVVVLALLLFGSRSFVTGGIPPVGEFLQFPDSPRDLLGRFASGWNPTGAGATEANPTGMAAISVLSVSTLFRMGLLHTVFIIGLVVVGLIGLWKLVGVFPTTRARVGALAVYAASPLVSGAFATGALDVLVAFAAVPWVLHTLRRAVGVEAADPRTIDLDIPDGIVALGRWERLQRTVQFALVVALASAFTPAVLFISLAIGVLLAFATVLAFAAARTALWYLGVTIVGTALAALLNVPWVSTWNWDAIVGPPPIGDAGIGWRALASFEIGPTDFVALSLALYVPVVAALLIARAWRLTWAVRSAVLIVAFGSLAVLGDRGSLPFPTPQAGILLAPIAAGLAISAAASLAAFDLDVRGGKFGWRQPLGLVASIAVAIGVVPGLVAVTTGDWDAPTTPLSRLIEAQLPAVPEDGPGDYHVLVVGDARLLPVPGTEYRDGVSFAMMTDDDLDIADRWAPTERGNATIIDALDQIASGSTQRAGRLLAPLGVRYVVIPEFDGVNSTSDDPMELPVGLVGAFDEQLDIVSSRLPSATVEIYENTSWIPLYSLLRGPTADASRTTGDATLVSSDLDDSIPIFSGTDARTALRNEVLPGVVGVGVPFDDRWTLEVDGEPIEPRSSFGVATGFDIEQAGVGTLSYSTPSSRTLLVLLQVALWLVALFVAARISVPLASRRRALVDDETLISIDHETDAEMFGEGFDPAQTDVAAGAPALDPGLDLTGQVARVDVAVDDGASEDHAPLDDGGVGIIDELPWVDELMEGEISDPITVADDAADESEEQR